MGDTRKQREVFRALKISKSFTKRLLLILGAQGRVPRVHREQDRAALRSARAERIPGDMAGRCHLGPRGAQLRPSGPTPTPSTFLFLTLVTDPRRSLSLKLRTFCFFTLVTDPGRSLSLKLSDTTVYEPQIRARLEPLILNP